MPQGPIVSVSLFTVPRPKRIDCYIDYFGSGGARPTEIAADPCGESVLGAALSDRISAFLARLMDGEGSPSTGARHGTLRA